MTRGIGSHAELNTMSPPRQPMRSSAHVNEQATGVVQQQCDSFLQCCHAKPMPAMCEQLPVIPM